MSATKEVLKALAEEYLHEFVHVTPVNDIHEPFIHKDETGLMRCVLCSTEWMSPTVMKSHVRGNFQGNCHRLAFLEMKSLREEKWKVIHFRREDKCHGHNKCAALLSSQQWRWHVSHLLMKYMTSSIPHENQCFEEVTTTLRRYEAMEGAAYEKRTKALGLLRWRCHMSDLLTHYNESSAACEGDRFEALLTTLVRYEKMEKLSLLELAVWKARRESRINDTETEEAKVSVHDMRITSGVQVIIPFVLTFLDDEWDWSE